MDTEEIQMVPYIVHESCMARQERTIKRLWILCIIMFLSLVVSNAGWIWYESQWEDVTTTTTQEVEQDSGDGGDNLFVGGDLYGEAKSKNNNDD